MANRWGNNGNRERFYFGELQSDCSHEIKRHLLLGRKVITNLDSILKEQRHNFANTGPSSQSYCFSTSHVWMSELDYRESWALKNCCFWTVVLEKTLEIPLDSKEIKPINPKGNQPWILSGRIIDAEADTVILWPPDVRTDSLEKSLMLGKIEGRRKRRGWDVWMASPTQWTWVWVNSGSWWWTGKPGVLQSMGSQRVGHDWETELNWKMVQCMERNKCNR